MKVDVAVQEPGARVVTLWTGREHCYSTTERATDREADRNETAAGSDIHGVPANRVVQIRFIAIGAPNDRKGVLERSAVSRAGSACMWMLTPCKWSGCGIPSTPPGMLIWIVLLRGRV